MSDVLLHAAHEYGVPFMNIDLTEPMGYSENGNRSVFNDSKEKPGSKGFNGLYIPASGTRRWKNEDIRRLVDSFPHCVSFTGFRDGDNARDEYLALDPQTHEGRDVDERFIRQVHKCGIAIPMQEYDPKSLPPFQQRLDQMTRWPKIATAATLLLPLSISAGAAHLASALTTAPPAVTAFLTAVSVSPVILPLAVFGGMGVMMLHIMVWGQQEKHLKTRGAEFLLKLGKGLKSHTHYDSLPKYEAPAHQMAHAVEPVLAQPQGNATPDVVERKALEASADSVQPSTSNASQDDGMMPHHPALHSHHINPQDALS